MWRRSGACFFASVVAVGLLACGQSDPPTAGGAEALDTAGDDSWDSASAEDEAERDAAGPDVDLTARAFDPDHLLEVEIELPAADWDELRYEVRPRVDLYAPDCLDDPFGSPYTWFTGSVTVDGERFEGVGVRKKGFFGSHNPEKPSMKVRFDKYVEGQRFADLKRMTLNNGTQMGRAYPVQCMTYALYAAAGRPAPRCNFAHVVVNGVDLGVYVHVESIKKPMLRRHFDDDDGDLWEGTVSDFRAPYLSTFEAKSVAPGADARLHAVADALELPDEQLLGALEAHLDLDGFLTHWALEVLVAHWDGYAGNLNNYYLYRDPTSDRLQFIPWGTDATFRVIEGAWLEGLAPLTSVYAGGLLTQRLYAHPEGRQRYRAALQELLAEVWDEAWLLAEVDRMRAVIGPALREAEVAEVDGSLAAVRAFIEQQRQAVVSELAEDPDWTLPLRDWGCGVANGSFSATFETTWDTWPTINGFETGTGSFSGTIDGVAIEGVKVGAAAGEEYGGQFHEYALVNIPVAVPGEPVRFVYVAIAPYRIEEGVPLEVDGTTVYAHVGVLTGDGAAALLGAVFDGQVELEAMAMEPGAPVRGSVVGELVRLD